MKAGLRIVLGIAAAIAIVVIGLSAVWFLWGRYLWAPGMMGSPRGYVEKGGTLSGEVETGETCGWEDPGTTGTTQGDISGDGDTQGKDPSLSGKVITIAQAQEAVKVYVKNLSYVDLEIAEMMEFEHNFYAIVCEHDTGIGAMELLVDKITGAVGPETGPNMMWNARYGMHRRGAMMGRTSDVNTLSEERAVEIARRWLDANRPGVDTEEHTDPFYGYYTIHTTRDGEIEGMLSVHGTTGQVWYHTWHGAFVQMIEGESDHD